LSSKMNHCKREDHLRKDRAMHSHEIGPFAVLGHVARTNLPLLINFYAHNVNGRTK
jgi:hypothetical protein